MISSCLGLSTDLCGAAGPKPFKPQRSLPGSSVSLTQFPIDLRTSMEEKYKEIAEVKLWSQSWICLKFCYLDLWICFGICPWDFEAWMGNVANGFVWTSVSSTSPLVHWRLPGITCFCPRSCSRAAWQKARCVALRTSSRRTAPSKNWKSNDTASRDKSARILSEIIQTHCSVDGLLDGPVRGQGPAPASHMVSLRLTHTRSTASNVLVCGLTNPSKELTGLAIGWQMSCCSSGLCAGVTQSASLSLWVLTWHGSLVFQSGCTTANIMFCLLFTLIM